MEWQNWMLPKCYTLEVHTKVNYKFYGIDLRPMMFYGGEYLPNTSTVCVYGGGDL